MAKRMNGYGFKGEYNHKTGLIGEYDKKSDTTTYYSITEALSEFHEKSLSISFKEENGVTAVENIEDDSEEE